METKLNPDGDWTRELVVLGVIAISIFAMFLMGAEAKDIILPIAGGLVGFLTGRKV